MKRRRFISYTVVIIMILIVLACINSSRSKIPWQTSKKIYLYGEEHGIEKTLDKELALWYEYYHNQDMRHLFVEAPYYTAEFLNLWMKSDSNDILDEVYNDWIGAIAHTPEVKEFYEKIKSQCPETIFHGTDVGHQYLTTGERFLDYLESNDLEESEQYVLTQEAIKQGIYYYHNSDNVYRENMMAENFIREYDKLSDESIMGIYGSAHTWLEAMDYTNAIQSMAFQVKNHYGDIVCSEDLAILANDIDPYRVDTIRVDGKDYEALYLGKRDLTLFSEEYTYREFWRLENAYDDFMDRPITQDVLPYNNYPIQIDTGQIFVIDYTKTDGTVIRKYYRFDGYVWNDLPSTQEFIVD